MFELDNESLQSINDISDVNNLPEIKSLNDYNYHRHRHHPSASSSSSTLTMESSSSSTSTFASSSPKKLGRSKKRGIPNTMKYPDFPVKTQCPECNKFVTTQITHKNGRCVYVLAMGLFSLTVVLFWVPFVVDSCKDIKHICPNCNTRLGTRHRL